MVHWLIWHFGDLKSRVCQFEQQRKSVARADSCTTGKNTVLRATCAHYCAYTCSVFEFIIQNNEFLRFGVAFSTIPKYCLFQSENPTFVLYDIGALLYFWQQTQCFLSMNQILRVYIVQKTSVFAIWDRVDVYYVQKHSVLTETARCN